MFINHAVRAAFELLPAQMYSPEAVQMIYAIGQQESRFEHRHQLGGPAKGFWQFELGGVRGVMAHPSTAPILPDLMVALQYDADWNAKGLHATLEHNDVLAACMARLLLWTLPDALPAVENLTLGWTQYKSAWRPGKPHPQTWKAAWDVASLARSRW